ncbi:MAG TPA: tRNA (guanosine(46)-N7)-methyltransferase TrmB [Synergistales bacterium]|nr:tRNA (guanosine(46)-N7)-methyltransferase TrmB [Synergistales bacterium]
MPLGEILVKSDPHNLVSMISGEHAPYKAVEIGFGNGEFLLQRASERPDGLFYGIEVSRNSIMKATKRAKRSSSRNVRFFYGDARFILNECFPEAWLDAVYMNFPCPWPKNRHAKRRVTTRYFVNGLAGVLKVGGSFELVTDDRQYAEEAAAMIPSHPAIVIDLFEPDPFRSLRTKYEKKWLEAGKRIFLLRFIKEKPFGKKDPKKGVIGLHKSLGRPCPALSELALLVGKRAGQREARWVFRDCFVNPSGVILVETLTSDEGFEQTFFFRIVPRSDGCLIKTDPATRPFTTPSVAGAFKDVTSLLEDGAQ